MNGRIEHEKEALGTKRFKKVWENINYRFFHSTKANERHSEQYST